MEENRDETPKKKRPQHKTMQKERRRQQRVWLGRHSTPHRPTPLCPNLNALTHICFSLSLSFYAAVGQMGQQHVLHTIDYKQIGFGANGLHPVSACRRHFQ